jgi:hypothetical protein
MDLYDEFVRKAFCQIWFKAIPECDAENDPSPKKRRQLIFSVYASCFARGFKDENA